MDSKYKYLRKEWIISQVNEETFLRIFISYIFIYIKKISSGNAIKLESL